MDLSDKLKIFRDHMVYNYTHNKTSKYYNFICLADKYSPKLDVTARVKEVIPTVKSATLTIIGSDPFKLSYEGPVTPPPQPLYTSSEIVSNWLNGINIERQKDPDTDKWVAVKFPAKLEIKGGLPETYKIPFEGKQPKIVFNKAVRSDWYGRFIVAHDPYRKRILIYLFIDQKGTDWREYKWIIRFNNKEYEFGPGYRVIKYETSKPTKIFIGRIRGKWLYEAVNITLPSTGSSENKITISTKPPKDYPGMIIHASPSVGKYYKENLLKDIISSGVYDDNIRYVYGFNFYKYQPNLPKSIPQENLIEAKKVWGYDIVRRQDGVRRGVPMIMWFGLWPKNQTTIQQTTQPTYTPVNTKNQTTTQHQTQSPCTIDDFIHTYLEHGKIIQDVTTTVQLVYPNIKKAKLVIHMDNNRIKLSDKFDDWPPEIDKIERVKHWIEGYEWVRMKCSKNEKYYYVKFPCTLMVENPTQHTYTPIDTEIQTTTQQTTQTSQSTQTSQTPQQTQSPQQTQPSQPTVSSNITEMPIINHSIFQNIPLEVVIPLIMVGGYLLIKKK